MYKADLPVDQSIEKAVERRRSAETARKARIYNTRLRVLGLDLDALNKQVQEKKHQQNTELQWEKAFDKLREHHDEILLQQDIDEREKRAALHTDLTQYWATQQRVEDSRDADLKYGLKGAFRFTIPEGELGSASMTIFQAAERAEKLKEQQRREERENLEDMLHTATSDMMTECAEAAEREVERGRPTRVLIDRWKGMSAEQLSAIQREREEQRFERQRQRDAEKIRDTAQELQLLKLSREAEEEERRAEKLRREKRIQTDHFNMQLAREQQAHQEYLNKKLYTNKPTKDYFYQFNTGSR
uniref:RIB43A-like with coiled-coils protein 1 isoform X2 n=1 Tax=Epinephelus lanceolatus TaxID=310571 RepID=UPI0014461659|nr:RIB43A-like with coiled-coils protein 1 isoform X2 [Epinephelus lanceolatus]